MKFATDWLRVISSRRRQFVPVVANDVVLCGGINGFRAERGLSMELRDEANKLKLSVVFSVESRSLAPHGRKLRELVNHQKVDRVCEDALLKYLAGPIF